MSSQQQANVFFVAVARNNIIIGSYAHNNIQTDLAGVKKMLEQPDVVNMVSGKHYSFTTEEVGWHLIKDEFSLTYILICKQYYPQRVAHACLEDLQLQFTNKVGGNSATDAKEKSYDRTCSSLFQSICSKYNNIAEVDKLSAVTLKVESVKVTMQENVSVALANCVKLESIEQATDELVCFLCSINFHHFKICIFLSSKQQIQAGVFKKNATDLKNKMWWKNLKVN